MSGSTTGTFLNQLQKTWLTPRVVRNHYFRTIALILSTLVLINARSFPLVWHMRVLRQLVEWNLRKALSPNKRLFMQKTSPVAQDPFKVMVTQKFWAGPDDCDFLGHLSNSSYAKNLDIARMKVCIINLRPFMLEGGWMPLAGADYAFISEIRLFSHYEVRSKVASWDEKWLYLLSEFVTHSPAPQTASSGSRSGTEKGPTPHSALSLPKADPKATRPDGTRLHCLAISRYCFKIGRLTVPPRIAMAICGFGPDRSNWLRSASMQEEGTLRMFLEGGWRKERGWELGEYEEKRAAGMVWCEKLKEGITALADW
ncbi:hypothetical protein NLI96_g6374 [Meripilus lineatus]|uniref:Thioesterase n=1 Tax=Meripilus lineatus TaxID=2056292 RepID=A0AAD5YDZ0_9APHY|nr:hypothetical protein NLI96_g6374 [Physisporinus lineatus]